MSETISAAEANRQFSKILRAVAAGGSFTITSHGRPVARLCPVAEADGQDAKRAGFRQFLNELAQQPVENIGKWTRDELYER